MTVRLGLLTALSLIAAVVAVPIGPVAAQNASPFGQPVPKGQPPNAQRPAQQQARPAQQQAQPQARVAPPQARPQPAPQRRVEERRRGPDGRYIAGGIAAGILGAIILNEATRSRSGRDVEVIEDDEAPRLNCRRLADRCEDGERWACRRLRRECDE